MIAGLLTLLAQPPLTNNLPAGRIEIPPAIARQVTPYMNCTTQRSNADPRMPASDAATVRAINAAARAACADLRRRGADEAERILGRDPAHRDPNERAAFINNAFDQVDRAADGLANALELMNSPAVPAGNN